MVSNHHSWSVLYSCGSFTFQNGFWEILAQEIYMQGLLDGYATALTAVLVVVCGVMFGLGLLAGKLIWG